LPRAGRKIEELWDRFDLRFRTLALSIRATDCGANTLVKKNDFLHFFFGDKCKYTNTISALIARCGAVYGAVNIAVYVVVRVASALITVTSHSTVDTLPAHTALCVAVSVALSVALSAAMRFALSCALMKLSSVSSHYVGLFCQYVGFFCQYVGFFCQYTGLQCLLTPLLTTFPLTPFDMLQCVLHCVLQSMLH